MAAEDDFGDSFGESMTSPDNRGAAGGSGGKKVANQRFDEVHELSGDFDESIDTHAQSMSMQSPANPRGGSGGGADTPPKGVPDDGERSGYPPDDIEIPERARARGRMAGPDDDDEDEDEEEDGEEEEEDTEEEEEEVSGAGTAAAGHQPSLASASASAMSAMPGADIGGSGEGGSTASMPSGYDPTNYSHLRVSKEIEELFEHIGRYSPHVHDLPTKLKPFIPDFMPSVGEIDPIIKPPRPDGEEETLGFAKLDEPASHPSDPTVLELRLRAFSKKSHLEPTYVRSIAEADKNPREVQKWIDSVQDLHRSKPPPQVRYSKPMPDVEALMQEWPEQIESLLSAVQSPSADLDLSLEEYSRLACALTGIPVHSSDTIVQSLHVLFTLYAEFRANQHFQVGGGAAPTTETA